MNLKFILFSCFIFAKCLITTEANESVIQKIPKKRVSSIEVQNQIPLIPESKFTETIKPVNENIIKTQNSGEISSTTEQINKFQTTHNPALEIVSGNYNKTGLNNKSLQDNLEKSTSNSVTSSTERIEVTNEFQTTHNPALEIVPKNDNKTILNNKSLQVIPITSTSNSIISSTPDPRIETTPTPEVFIPDEIYHPIIDDFLSRIKYAASTNQTPEIPKEIDFFNLRDPDLSKSKYFQKILNGLFTSTYNRNDPRDWSVIRAYHETHRQDFSTTIDHRNQDESILSPAAPKPFNTRMDLSPRFDQLSINRYDFFPRYINGSLVVITDE